MRRERSQHGERRGERPADGGDHRKDGDRDCDADARPREDAARRARGTRTGVATTACHVFTHLMPAMTGNVVTLEAVCIAVVARSAGATNWR